MRYAQAALRLVLLIVWLAILTIICNRVLPALERVWPLTICALLAAMFWACLPPRERRE